jgi:hypothetical protein
MINDHNNDRRLGGPNADVMERLEALKKPKLVQPNPLCSYCSKRHPIELFEGMGMKISTCPDVPPDTIISFDPRKFQEFPAKHLYEPVDEKARRADDRFMYEEHQFNTVSILPRDKAAEPPTMKELDALIDSVDRPKDPVIHFGEKPRFL